MNALKILSISLLFSCGGSHLPPDSPRLHGSYVGTVSQIANSTGQYYCTFTWGTLSENVNFDDDGNLVNPYPEFISCDTQYADGGVTISCNSIFTSTTAVVQGDLNVDDDGGIPSVTGVAELFNLDNQCVFDKLSARIVRDGG